MSEQLPRKIEKQLPQEFIAAIEQVDMPLVHAVMFKFHEETSLEEIATVIRMCRALKESPGILTWTVQESLDNRKGRTALELGVFKSGQAFIDFHDSPIHQEFAYYIRDYADWDIVDFPANELSSETFKLLVDIPPSDDIKNS